MFESVLSTPLDVCNSLTAEKMKFSMKAFFSKCDQIRSLLRIWSHLMKNVTQNFIFCTVPYSVILYAACNLRQKICRHFCVLAEFFPATSETELDY